MKKKVVSTILALGLLISFSGTPASASSDVTINVCPTIPYGPCIPVIIDPNM